MRNETKRTIAQCVVLIGLSILLTLHMGYSYKTVEYWVVMVCCLLYNLMEAIFD